MDPRIEGLRLLLEDPTSNLTAAALGLAMIVLFVIIVVLAVLAWALPSSGPTVSVRTKQRTVRRSPRKGPRGSWMVVGVGAATIALSVAAAYVATSSSEFCSATCHAMVPIGETWENSVHKEVPCIRCHEGRYGFSAPQAIVSRARSGVLEATDGSAEGAIVTSRLCLQCHASILKGTVQGPRGLLMSHREVIDRGSQCSDCHGDQGHTNEIVTVGMAACLRCHDGINASAECVTCHPKGADAAIEFTEQTFGSPVALKEKPDCGGCHSQTKCDACHGLRMPHPDHFKEPQTHAKLAAFTRMHTLCYRCHVEADCTGCHQPFGAHGKNWFAEHAKVPRDESQWCNNCHRTPDFCSLCHP